jgi:hypothetical protein
MLQVEQVVPILRIFDVAKAFGNRLRFDESGG